MPKPTLDEYPQWSRDQLGFDPSDPQFVRRYTINTNNIRNEIEKSDQWAVVSETFENLSRQYKHDNHVYLFTDDKWLPSLHVKPVSSLIEKTYRNNILRNKNFPNHPNGGWFIEDNIFARIGDLIRCRVVCRYMDGPEYICNAASKLLGDAVVSGTHSMETELGYYAWHMGLLVPVPIMKPNGNVIDETVEFEVQLTTHLNDVLNDLTHVFYEGRRIKEGVSDSKWKWQPNEAKFKGAYFGHTLHLLEGMIVELKNEMAKAKDK